MDVVEGWTAMYPGQNCGDTTDKPWPSTSVNAILSADRPTSVSKANIGLQGCKADTSEI